MRNWNRTRRRRVTFGTYRPLVPQNTAFSVTFAASCESQCSHNEAMWSLLAEKSYSPSIYTRTHILALMVPEEASYRAQ